jgi:hypothetical protein
VLDQREQRLLGPVDVLEDEDEGLRLRHQLRPLACRPRDLLLAALAVDGLEDADREAEQVGDGLSRARVSKLLDRDLERVVVGDVRGALDHLGQRPVGDALAVGQRAPGQDRGALEAVQELLSEAALADSGLAVDGEEVRATVSDHAGVRVLEQLDLRFAPDERRDDHPRGGAPVGADRRPRPDGLGLAAELDRPHFLDFDATERQPVRPGADEDLARLGGLLEARRDVHGLAGGEGGVGGLGDHLAGLDADPRRQVDRLQDSQRRLHGALRVVLVRLRHAESGHDRVAGELLHGAAMALDALRDLGEEQRHAAAHDLGVAGRDQAAGVDEVDEQDRGEFPFHRPNSRNATGRPKLPPRRLTD